MALRAASFVAAAAATVAAVAVTVTGETINSAAESDFDVYRHHPLHAGGDGPEPVLLKWYEVKLNERLTTQPRTRNSRYIPGGATYVMSEEKYPNNPLNDTAAANRYVGWDLLKLPYYGPEVDDWLRIGINRDARLCITLGWQLEEDISLPGWTRSGLAVAPEGTAVDLNDEMPQPEKAGVFCRDAPAGVVTIPRARLLYNRAFGYDLLLGEADGSAPPRPAAPEGKEAVAPNTRCPDYLHDLWVTDAHDPDDADTAGKQWQSWHPQVDPIYWCYYGHDHGTAPFFMGSWRPKWHYTAWKNKYQSESHIGFKGYGLRSGGANYYFSVHASTSDMRRVHERFHTVTMTAAVAGEVVADISCKGDFGFSFTLNRDFMRDVCWDDGGLWTCSVMLPLVAARAVALICLALLLAVGVRLYATGGCGGRVLMLTTPVRCFVFLLSPYPLWYLLSFLLVLCCWRSPHSSNESSSAAPGRRRLLTSSKPSTGWSGLRTQSASTCGTGRIHRPTCQLTRWTCLAAATRSGRAALASAPSRPTTRASPLISRTH